MDDLIERLRKRAVAADRVVDVADIDALRAENKRLHAAIDRLRATFRVNMLRHCASATHDEITRVLDEAIKEAGNE